jgi:tRNA A37 threonylcarbamoyladenosine dehydratase
MQRDALLTQLREFGLHTPQAYMTEAFSRNLGFLTRAEQQALANATVAIPGMGGVGGAHLITLVRTGVGRFHLADFLVLALRHAEQKQAALAGGI